MLTECDWWMTLRHDTTHKPLIGCWNLTRVQWTSRWLESVTELFVCVHCTEQVPRTEVTATVLNKGVHTFMTLVITFYWVIECVLECEGYGKQKHICIFLRRYWYGQWQVEISGIDLLFRCYRYDWSTIKFILFFHSRWNKISNIIQKLLICIPYFKSSFIFVKTLEW